MKFVVEWVAAAVAIIKISESTAACFRLADPPFLSLNVLTVTPIPSSSRNFSTRERTDTLRE